MNNDRVLLTRRFVHLAKKSGPDLSWETGGTSAMLFSGKTNERDGITHDYRARADVEATFIGAPKDAAWAQDRSALWNAAELAEMRKGARVALEYEIALPSELDAAGRRELVEGFAGELRDSYGMEVRCRNLCAA